jgi:hypothetical protein
MLLLKHSFSNFRLVRGKSVLIKNPPGKTRGIIYMDGLVSTGNKFPNTILKIILSIQKKIIEYFIHILFGLVDKRGEFQGFVIDYYLFIFLLINHST